MVATYICSHYIGEWPKGRGGGEETKERVEGKNNAIRVIEKRVC